MLETNSLIDDQDKCQSVTDTDKEFTECGFNGISPVSLHTFMKTLKSDISETYEVQVDCLKDSESEKENEWLG